MIGPIPSFSRLWVFSDLHLADPDSPLYQAFIQSLSEPDSPQDAVVFAGDIFEILVGNSAYFKQKNHTFFEALRNLAQRKVQMFYIQGNHDFHLGPAFSGLPIRILDSELILGNIYIAHGDLVDRADHGYLLMRKLFRSSGFQKLIDLLPGKVVEKVSESITRSHPQKEKDLYNAPGAIPRVRPIFRAFAEDKKRQGFDFVILGHCHDLDDLQPFYFNMGYPPIHRQFLFYTTESNSFRRRVFTGI